MKNFLDEDNKFPDYENSKITILPIPFEFSTSYVKGTKYGPEKIIEASEQLESYDYEFDFEPTDFGISVFNEVNCNSNNPNIVFPEIEKSIEKIFKDNKFPIILGGEHSISFPIIKKIMELKKDFGIIHFDAHSDLRFEYENTKQSHACVMRRIREINTNTLSLGIRSLCKDDSLYIKENKVNLFYTEESFFENQKIKDCLNKLPKDIYITLDVDAFDPSIIPATGTPEPNGMDWKNITNYLKFIFKTKNVLGIDIVELCPRKNEINSDFIIAKLVYKICAYKIKYGLN